MLTDYIKSVIDPHDAALVEDFLKRSHARNNETIISELAESDWHDKYGQLSPVDSDLWLNLIVMADREYDKSLALRLLDIRNRGSVLIPHDKYGYAIRPVIGPNGWMSAQEYDRARGPLLRYEHAIILMLGRLKDANI